MLAESAASRTRQPEGVKVASAAPQSFSAPNMRHHLKDSSQIESQLASYLPARIESLRKVASPNQPLQYHPDSVREHLGVAFDVETVVILLTH
jgi:hypothetical protein